MKPATHQAFAVAIRVNDTGNIACVHRIFRYPGSFTESSPWDNKLFGILGDITANQIPLVHIAPEVFAVAGSVYAPTLPIMDEALANWEPHSDEKGDFMGPMSDAAGNSLYGQYTDYFTVRSIVYLPPRYAAMVVSRQIPAAQDWLEIGGAIRKDGLTRECADLLTWLRAGNCWGRPEDGDPESRIPIVAMTALQYVVPLPGNLATYAARKIALDFPQVQQKLPNVSTNNMTPEHFAAAMATALAHKPGRDSKESTVITPKLPSSKFRGLLPLLLKICEVEN